MFYKQEVSDMDKLIAREQYSLKLDSIIRKTDKDALSTEAIVDKSEGEANLWDRLKHHAIDIKDNVVGIANLFAGYDANKLRKTLDMINNGEMVPRKEVKGKNKIYNKFATFMVLGHDFNKVDDVIAYLNKPIEDVLTGKYSSLITKQFVSLFSPDTRNSKYKYKPTSVNVDLDKIKLNLKLNANQKDDIIISFLINPFYHKLHLYTLVITDDGEKNEGIEWFDHKFLNNIDIIEIRDSYLQRLDIWDKEDIIKLIRFGIDRERDIKNVVGKSKMLLLDSRFKGMIQGALIGLTSVLAIPIYMLIGRFTDSYVTHISNLLKSIVWYDKLILDIVDSMYEKNK